MGEATNTNCPYCMKGELLAKFGYPICEMKSGYLYLFKETEQEGPCDSGSPQTCQRTDRT